MASKENIELAKVILVYCMESKEMVERLPKASKKLSKATRHNKKGSPETN